MYHIERLITAPVIATHHRVDEERCAVVQSAGRIVAQDDGVADALRMSTDPPQREKVVAIQTGVGDLHAHPIRGHVRFGLFSDLQWSEWIVRSSVSGLDRKHLISPLFDGNPHFTE